MIIMLLVHNYGEDILHFYLSRDPLVISRLIQCDDATSCTRCLWNGSLAFKKKGWGWPSPSLS
jgi:hypothetical protein